MPPLPTSPPAILNEFISRIEVHERDQKRARYAIQHISIYFNYIGRFENEVTQLAEPTEQEIRQMREEIEEAKKKKSRAYHRQYSREYRARNLEKQREYDRIKGAGIPGKEKGADRRRTARTVKQNNRQPRGDFPTTGNPLFRRPEKGADYGRTERDAHRTPEPRQYHHDAEERADHCCGVIFQSQQHRNIPRQAAQDDTCRQFAFIRV